jgi:hypothetical protein
MSSKYKLLNMRKKSIGLLLLMCLLFNAEKIQAQNGKEILVGVEYFNGWWEQARFWQTREVLTDSEKYFSGWWEQSPETWERQNKDWRPLYPERVPLLGAYSSQETMDKEIAAASEYGVDFFSILWYYPGNVEDKKVCDLLNSGLDFYMNSPNSYKMKFMVELCNHKPFAITTDEDWDKCMDVCVNAMKHPSYLRVDGRAVLKIHGGDQFYADNDSNLERSRQILQHMRQKAKEAGVGELLITVGTYGNKPVDSEHTFVQAGIDGTMQYMDPTDLPMKEIDYSYDLLAARAKKMRDLRKNDAISWTPYLPAGWNPRPWSDPRASFSFPSRKQWKSSLKELKEDLLKSSNLGLPRKDGTTQKAFTIFAWNEFAEGGMLVPTVGDQYMKLEVVKEVFGK